MISSKTNGLVKIIGVDKDKCVNCHACITACPVKFCNDGSGDYVTVNENMCIACGNCLTVCTHGSRYFVDDFDIFMSDVESDIKMIAIVAPSIAASFPEKYLHLNGWLKSLGIKAIFDVSFGAELTVKSYVDYIENKKPEMVIAQPCPAIVTYIELYQPELLKYLIPVHSPMLHTIKMIKEFYPQYRNHKIAVISPCNAKKREFIETGEGNYNIAYSVIDKYLNENNISLESFEPIVFDNPPAERAVMFSSPGGLLKTAERVVPDISLRTRKIEGPHAIYPYLKKLPETINKKKNPLLVDCLNCEFGCNTGPFTLTNDKPLDEIESLITERNIEMQAYYKKTEKKAEINDTKSIDEILTDYWKPGLYTRTYKNQWANVKLKYPDEDELWEIYRSMHKYSEADIYNCSACGYGNCKDMAIAIFNNLNRPDNCHFYLNTETKNSHIEVEKRENRLKTILETSIDGFIQVDNKAVIKQANPALCKMLRKADLIGRSFMEFMDDENRDILKQQLKYREQSKEGTYELQLTSSDGKKLDCLISGTPFYDENGNKIGSFAMISDITELKKAQIELQEANESLEGKVKERTQELYESLEELKISQELIEAKNDELEKLSVVASETNNAVMIMDKDTNIDWVNQGFERMLGYNLYDFKNGVGKSLKEITKYDWSDDIAHCVKNKKSIAYELKFKAKNGKAIWTQTNLTPILDEYDNLKMILTVSSDITHLKEAKEEILKQNEEINEQKSQLEAQKDALEQKNQEVTDAYNNIQVLSEFGQQITATLDVKEMQDMLFIYINSLVKTSALGLGLYNPSIKAVCFHGYVGEKGTSQPFSRNVTLKNSLTAWCFNNQETVLINNIESDYTKYISEFPVENRNLEHKSLIFTPLIFKNVTTGVLILKAKEKNAYKKEDLNKLKTITSYLAIALENANAYRIVNKKNELIRTNIRYALNIQKAMLPKQEDVSGYFENFLVYRPRDIVSGDFYWYACLHRKNNNPVHFAAVVDCTGHGVAGALLSMKGSSLLNQIVYKKNITEPNEVLETLDKLIDDEFKQSEKYSEIGMDICLIKLEKQEQNKTKITFSGAKRPLFYCNGNFTTETLSGTRRSIEVLKDNGHIKFNNNEIILDKGTMLYLSSDGYSDQNSPERKRFGSKRLKELFAKNSQQALNRQKDILENQLDKHQQKEPQRDDICIWGIRI